MSKEMYEAALDFIDDIPGLKLLGGFPGKPCTIHSDLNYRLDMQTITTGPPKAWNLQIQANKGPKKRGKSSRSSAHQAAEKGTRKAGSIAMILVPVDDPWSPAEIKQALKAEVMNFFEK